MDRSKHIHPRIKGSGSDKGDGTDEFMLPCNHEKSGQDQNRDVVHDQADEDITDTTSGPDHIQGEHGKKKDQQNRQNPWCPVNKFSAFH